MEKKSKKMSVSEKIDLFEKYLNENPDKEIHGNTVYEGYQIGSYLIQLRQSMLYSKNNIEYDNEDKRRMEDLGLLSGKKDSLKDKAERLKLFCEKYPYAFTYANNLKAKLQKKGNIEEANNLENLCQDYIYIISRRSRGRISDKMEQDLVNARVGGVFGLSNKDKDLIENYAIYDIDYITLMKLIQDFGSIDSFKKQYIQYKVDLSKAKTFEQKNIVHVKYIDIQKYLDSLPLVDDYYLCNRKKIKPLLYKIGLKNSNQDAGLVYDDEMEYVIRFILEAENQKNRRIFELRFGLDDGEKKTFKQIGKELNIGEKNASQVVREILKKYRKPEYKKMIEEHIYIPNEEFIRNYFAKHDVFYKPNETQMPSKEIDELLNVYGRKRKFTINKDTSEKDSPNTENIEKLGIRPKTRIILNDIGIYTISDLVEKIYSLDDFLMISGIGKKERFEITKKIHSLGYKFKWEKAEKDEKSQGINDKPIGEIGLSKRGSNALKRKGIYTIQSLLNKINSFDDLKDIRGIGKSLVNEIITKVHDLGYKFKWEILDKEDKSNIEPSDQIEILNRKKKEIIGNINRLLDILNGKQSVDSKVNDSLKQAIKLLQEQKSELNKLDREIVVANKRNFQEKRKEKTSKLIESAKETR